MSTNKAEADEQSPESIYSFVFPFLCQGIPLRKVIQKKLSFENTLALILKFSYNVPSKRELSGTYWIDDEHFAFKTKNFAEITGLKMNTVNCNLRQHNFVKCGNLPEKDKIGFQEPRNWKIMKHQMGQFTRKKVQEGKQRLTTWCNPKKRILREQIQLEELNECDKNVQDTDTINFDFDSEHETIGSLHLSEDNEQDNGLFSEDYWESLPDIA